MSAKDYEIVLCKDSNLYINKKDGESTRSTDSKKLSEDGIAEIAKFFKKEEPVSEDLEQAIDNYLATYFGGEQEKQDWPFLKKMAIHFANWQKQQMESYRIEHCKSLTNEQAELEETFVSSHVEKNNRIPTFIDAIEYGMELQKDKSKVLTEEQCRKICDDAFELGKDAMKQQLMANAVDGVAACATSMEEAPYVRSLEGISYLKGGDKVKLIVIKEGKI